VLQPGVVERELDKRTMTARYGRANLVNSCRSHGSLARLRTTVMTLLTIAIDAIRLIIIRDRVHAVRGTREVVADTYHP